MAIEAEIKTGKRRTLGCQLIAILSLVSCNDINVERFRDHCMQNMGVRVLDSQAWAKYLELASDGNGIMNPRPFIEQVEKGRYLRYSEASGGGEPCSLKSETSSLKELCKDGTFYKRFVGVYVTQHKVDISGDDQTIERELIAEVRSDFYVQQNLEPQLFGCFSAFHPDYISQFKTELAE